MQPEWSCWHWALVRGLAPPVTLLSLWPGLFIPRGSGGPGAAGNKQDAGSAGWHLADPCSCSLSPQQSHQLSLGSEGVAELCKSLSARTIPGFCGSAVAGRVLLSSRQGHRSWPSSQALTCWGRQGAIDKHGKGQCSLHSAFVGSQVKPDICI